MFCNHLIHASDCCKAFVFNHFSRRNHRLTVKLALNENVDFAVLTGVVSNSIFDSVMLTPGYAQ
jgi:hypothetical protein